MNSWSMQVSYPILRSQSSVMTAKITCINASTFNSSVLTLPLVVPWNYSTITFLIVSCSFLWYWFLHFLLWCLIFYYFYWSHHYYIIYLCVFFILSPHPPLLSSFSVLPRLHFQVSFSNPSTQFPQKPPTCVSSAICSLCFNNCQTQLIRWLLSQTGNKSTLHQGYKWYLIMKSVIGSCNAQLSLQTHQAFSQRLTLLSTESLFGLKIPSGVSQRFSR